MPARAIIEKKEMDSIQLSLANQVLDDYPDLDNLVLIGIQRRGADLARRLAGIMEQKTGRTIACGSLDINLYRDDWSCRSDGMPHINRTSMPPSVEGKNVLLVDDVLFSGRTIRAALEAIMDYGRATSVQLLVFIDRGHRELPICARYAGRTIATGLHQHVDVLFSERDGQDCVLIS